jgi:hypothetical protein
LEKGDTTQNQPPFATVSELQISLIKDDLVKLQDQRVVTSASRDWSLGLAWWQGAQP